MTDQTKSEYAVLLRNLDFAAAEFDSAIHEESAAAIRALEAKVWELESERREYEEGCVEASAEIYREVCADRDRLSETLAVEQRIAKSWQETAEKFRGERDRLAGEVERLGREDDANTRELHDICNALPGVAFMDPPDGGSVSIAEQVRRMYAALQSQDAEVARLTAELAAARENESRYRTIEDCIAHQGFELHRYTAGKAKRMWKFCRPFADDIHLHPTLDDAIDAARRAGEGEK